MRIIPVLDLKGGEVVARRKGQRDRYRPIVTPLSASSDPVAVAEGLRTLHPFPTFYIADLDAIEGRAPNARCRLRGCGPCPSAPELWVDAGISDEESACGRACRAVALPRAGLGIAARRRLLRRFRDHPGLILSLDFFADGFRGPASLLDDPALWPQTVIVMTLAKVGSAAGPDFARLEEIKARAGSRAVIAAGGVRNEADIRALSALGIAAALVATSLHDGTLTPGQLASLGT